LLKNFQNCGKNSTHLAPRQLRLEGCHLRMELTLSQKTRKIWQAVVSTSMY